MFKATIGRNELQSLIEAMSDLDLARFLYCQEMAGAYLAVGKFESMLISAMHLCDRVKLQKALGTDRDAWARSVAKKAQLEGSTLGSLIKILERHDIAPTDIAYLRWIKDKRDYFVHRLFHEDAWPGDLDEAGCRRMRRRLVAIQLWLERGERNIWLIFERAGFVELDRLDDGSMLAMNTGLYDLIQEDLPERASGDGKK
ncbi:hypothetical protein [uncultured Sphingomonas sp.]|uniref:hypothetical protein n=1 Tax=uncultured Sphingomonas sp. TaxID=158754 RepID=UPI002607F9DC|nr:hypothetical protein [uncultured Sphingomonas sp.]